MLAGRSYRTNAEGLRQLAQILAAEGASLESVNLPHDRGPGHVLHLMSLISPVADDLAVVYPPLAPVALMETLARRAGDPGGPGQRHRGLRDDGVQRPSRGAAAGGRGQRQPADRGQYWWRQAARCTATTGSEISLKGDGGPTCLTAPVWRGAAG